MLPHKVIRHTEMQNFWGTALKKDEVSWDTFWRHFPEELATEAAIDTNFGSIVERTAFQKAMHIVGAPDYITVAMVDAAFPPGCSAKQTTARYKNTLMSLETFHMPVRRTFFWTETRLQSLGNHNCVFPNTAIEDLQA